MTRGWAMALSAALVLPAGCAQPAPATNQSGDQAAQAQAPAKRKVLNAAQATYIDAFSIGGSSTTSGGGLSYIEVHSQALFSADKTTGRPIPRLLAEQPTQERPGIHHRDTETQRDSSNVLCTSVPQWLGVAAAGNVHRFV